jgi:hypothetical protein
MVLISCGIFREELKYLAEEKQTDLNVFFLEAALHVNFNKLRSGLIEALDACRQRGEEPLLLYGNCHPEMDKIAAAYSARRIDAGNCLEALAGRDEIQRLDAEAKTFFLTAGWVNNWEEMFNLGVEDLGLDFRAMFSPYKRIVVFDSGVIPINEEKVRRLSAYTSLPVEKSPLCLDHFMKLLEDLQKT